MNQEEANQNSNDKQQEHQQPLQLLENNQEPPPPSKAKPSRLTKTITFPDSETAYINEVIEARINAGITKDWNHFLRQCVDYAINADRVIKSKGLKNPLLFAIPEKTQSQPVNLKNAFFDND